MTRPLSPIGVLLVVGLVGLGARRADAHQLDEYLQAARIAAARDHLVVELSLTPGVAVAPRILPLVDRDGDGRISAAEIERYARRVLGDLELSVDGTAVPLALAHVDCPSWDEIREGTGTIRVEARTASGLAAGTHRLHFVNAHEPAMSVYLVNALVPPDPGVTIGAQRRDALQRRVDIDVEVAHSFASAYWLLALAAAIGALTLVRLSDHFALSGVHR